MSLKLTVICDNYVEKPGFLAEHGFSLLIETKSKTILFDTGQGLTIQHNARKLNINPGSVDCIVLSHGHYDHTGGLTKILNYQHLPVIYAHPDALQAKYKKLETEKMEYIGFPDDLKNESKLNIVFSSSPTQIAENMVLTGQIPRETFFEHIEEEFYKKSKDRWIKDEVLDDQALIIDGGSGLVAVLGCTHSGIINTLKYARQITGKKNFVLVIGGTHLKGASEKKISLIASELQDLNIKKIVLYHCSGILTFTRLARILGEDKVFLGKVGDVWEIPEK